MIVIINRILSETKESFKNEKAVFFSNLITMTVIFLILNFSMAYIINLKKINSFVADNMQIKVYLENGITDEGVKELQSKLYKYPEIKNIKYVSKEIALKQLAKNMETELDPDENPLPNVFVVIVEDGVNLSKLTEKLKQEAGIEEVDKKEEFISKLSKILKGINSAIVFVYILIAVPVFVLMFNLVHSSILHKKEDIEIMCLVGATKAYIKWPFILLGMIHTFFAALFSVIIFAPIYNFLKASLETILPVISLVPIKEMGVYIFLGILIFGIVITYLASEISIKLYLKMYGD